MQGLKSCEEYCSLLPQKIVQIIRYFQPKICSAVGFFKTQRHRISWVENIGSFRKSAIQLQYKAAIFVTIFGTVRITLPWCTARICAHGTVVPWHLGTMVQYRTTVLYLQRYHGTMVRPLYYTRTHNVTLYDRTKIVPIDRYDCMVYSQCTHTGIRAWYENALCVRSYKYRTY